jgi:hypothetical protein
VRFALHVNSFEAPLKEMTDSMVADIEGLRINLVEPFYAAGQIRKRGLHEQVVMVRHEHPGMEDPMMKLDDLSEELNEEEAIPIRAMDVPPLIATAGHMPDGSGTLQTERSHHEKGGETTASELRWTAQGGRVENATRVLVSQGGRPNRILHFAGLTPQAAQAASWSWDQRIK